MTVPLSTGGPDAAKPRAVLEEMGITGLTLRHVKSHLQVRARRRREGGCAVPIPRLAARPAPRRGRLGRCWHA